MKKRVSCVGLVDMAVILLCGGCAMDATVSSHGIDQAKIYESYGVTHDEVTNKLRFFAQFRQDSMFGPSVELTAEHKLAIENQDMQPVRHQKNSQFQGTYYALEREVEKDKKEYSIVWTRPKQDVSITKVELSAPVSVAVPSFSHRFGHDLLIRIDGQPLIKNSSHELHQIRVEIINEKGSTQEVIYAADVEQVGEHRVPKDAFKTIDTRGAATVSIRAIRESNKMVVRDGTVRGSLFAKFVAKPVSINVVP